MRAEMKIMITRITVLVAFMLCAYAAPLFAYGDYMITGSIAAAASVNWTDVKTPPPAENETTKPSTDQPANETQQKDSVPEKDAAGK
jgi:hypothetical protein